MILGGAVSLLLLLGGPQAPPEDRPTSGGGYLAEYPIEIGDPGDMGGGGWGGGSNYKNCKLSPGNDGKPYWIVVWTYSSGQPGATHDKIRDYQVALAERERICGY